MYNNNVAEKEKLVSKFRLNELHHFVKVVWQLLLFLIEGERRL